MNADDAWLAGLFEGEGCIFSGTHKRNGKAYPYWRLHITSTDEDVLQRVHRVANAGMLYGPRVDPKHPDRKPFWVWEVNKRQDIFDLLTRLRPQLGIRRGAKADRFFEHWAEYVPQGKTAPDECRKGHKMTEANTVMTNQGPTCRTCVNDAQRKRRAKR